VENVSLLLRAAIGILFEELAREAERDPRESMRVP